MGGAVKLALLLLLVGGSDVWETRFSGEVYDFDKFKRQPVYWELNRSDGGTVSISTDDLYDLVVYAREERARCLADAGTPSKARRGK